MKIAFLAIGLILSVYSYGQDINMFKTLNDSTFMTDKEYQKGNKYQKDAILFVDMLTKTHPYYIKKERRDSLMALMSELLNKCGKCNDDSLFTTYLDNVLGKLRDGHTNVIDEGRFKQQKTVKPAAAKEEETAPSGCLLDKHDALFDYTILSDKSICYLQFNQCADANTLRNPSLPRFDNMLLKMFGETDSLKIKTLIVDAQYNNGGSSMLCDQLLVMLKPLKDLKQYTTHIRFSDLMAMYNPRIAVAKTAWEKDGHTDELWQVPVRFPNTFQQPKVFEGQVVFIQGRRTYSSAGILMTMARDNKIGIIVGETSRFAPSHYGEVLPYRLPNTGALGSVSCKFFARPDTSVLYDETLVPDVSLNLDNKAAAWQWLLDKYAVEKR